jgi:hypothetical protein
MRKNLSENYPQFAHSLSKMFASPLLGRKILKNLGFKGLQIIALPRARTCIGPALLIT